VIFVEQTLCRKIGESGITLRSGEVSEASQEDRAWYHLIHPTGIVPNQGKWLVGRFAPYSQR
jgi:hypothetical protein